MLGRDRNYAQRAARTVDDLEWRSNHNCAGRWQQFQVHQAGNAEFARAVHVCVVWKWWVKAPALACIGADGFHSDA